MSITDEPAILNSNKCRSCGVPWSEHLGIAGTCAELQRVRGELAPFLPMSSEEAEAALDAIEAEDCPPVTPEEIERMLKYATDPKYRAECLWERYCAMHGVARGLRAENARLRKEIAEHHHKPGATP